MILRVLCRFKAQEDAASSTPNRNQSQDQRLITDALGKLRKRTKSREKLSGTEEKFTIKTDIVDVQKLAITFNSIIRSHAPQGHSSEVCWALWGCILFGVKVLSESADALIAMSDPAAALLGLHAQEKGLFPRKDYLKSFEQFLTKRDLYGEHWILAYEANIKGWLRSTVGEDNVAIDPRFSILKTNGVEFYDEAKVEDAFDQAAKDISEEEPEEPGLEGYF
jgi:hypothetical protein